MDRNPHDDSLDEDGFPQEDDLGRTPSPGARGSKSKKKVDLKQLKGGAFFMTQLSSVKSNKVDVSYYDWGKPNDDDTKIFENNRAAPTNGSDEDKSESRDDRTSDLPPSSQVQPSSAITGGDHIDLGMMNNDLSNMVFDENT